MKTPLSLVFTSALVLSSLTGCASSPATKSISLQQVPPVANTETSPVRVVTWNVEHLAYPANQGCKPRSETELEAMKSYAESLDADIVALQEVASAQAVYQLFPQDEWQVVMSTRPDSEPYDCRESGRPSTQQKLAFAVRNGIDIKQSEGFEELGLQRPGLRYGLEISVNTDLGDLTLLNVHLKSGCFVDNYSRSDKESCQLIARQVPVLQQWIEQQDQQGNTYMVLGDFNHRISAPYNKMTRTLNDALPALNIETAELIGCHPYYPAPIDHILSGHLDSKTTTTETQVHPFDNMDVEAMLSDHCAVSTTISRQSLPISPAVTWQTTSKEYQLITKALYAQAGNALAKKLLQGDSWVVMMDIDETVLDNSQYQVWLNQTGQNYSSQTWAQWVRSEQATLVPGVEDFIQQVFALGGKIALVTNRNKALDAYTWRNLQALGLAVTPQNTCLTGRSDRDNKAIDGNSIINDKDLRRQQLQQGKADCLYLSEATEQWQKPLEIVMQVGDNIEDINGVTQHDASPELLLQRWAEDVIILPNPMYGSW